MFCKLLPKTNKQRFFLNTFSKRKINIIMWTTIKKKTLLISILDNIFLSIVIVEPSGVQALKNPNPLKDDEGWLCLLLLCYLLDRIWGRFNM